MTTATKIAIQAIPISMYYITFLWFKRLIYKKIKDKQKRRIYKKLVKEDLAWFFIPLISGSVFVLFVFAGIIPEGGWPLYGFILKCLLLFVQILLAVIVFPILRVRIHELKDP